MNDVRSSHAPEAMIRTFVCLETPQSIQSRIEKLQAGLRRPDAQISWVRPANIHLTLRFLGDIPQAKIALVSAAVSRATGSCSPFQVTVGATGCFPSPRNPRVLWVGISPASDQLRTLHKAIETELARQGFAPDGKAFTPHLTVARIRNPQNARRLTEDFLACGFAEESFQAREVIVMRSQLSPQGAIYTPQAVLSLKG